MREERLTTKKARQASFLAAYMQTQGNKRAAAEISGIPESTIHRWFAKDVEFYWRAKGIFREVHEAVLLAQAISLMRKLY